MCTEDGCDGAARPRDTRNKNTTQESSARQAEKTLTSPKGTCCLLEHFEQIRERSEAAPESCVLEVAQGSWVSSARLIRIAGGRRSSFRATSWSTFRKPGAKAGAERDLSVTTSWLLRCSLRVLQCQSDTSFIKAPGAAMLPLPTHSRTMLSDILTLQDHSGSTAKSGAQWRVTRIC